MAATIILLIIRIYYLFIYLYFKNKKYIFIIVAAMFFCSFFESALLQRCLEVSRGFQRPYWKYAFTHPLSVECPLLNSTACPMVVWVSTRYIQWKPRQSGCPLGLSWCPLVQRHPRPPNGHQRTSSGHMSAVSAACPLFIYTFLDIPEDIQTVWLSAGTVWVSAGSQTPRGHPADSQQTTADTQRTYVCWVSADSVGVRWESTVYFHFWTPRGHQLSKCVVSQPSLYLLILTLEIVIYLIGTSDYLEVVIHFQTGCPR